MQKKASISRTRGRCPALPRTVHQSPLMDKFVVVKESAKKKKRRRNSQ
jgi:hypothetical protein